MGVFSAGEDCRDASLGEKISHSVLDVIELLSRFSRTDIELEGWILEFGIKQLMGEGGSKQDV